MLGQRWCFRLPLGLSWLSKLCSRSFLWQMFPMWVMKIHSTRVPNGGGIKPMRFGLQSHHLSFHAKAETSMFRGSYQREERFPSSLLIESTWFLHITLLLVWCYTIFLVRINNSLDFVLLFLIFWTESRLQKSLLPNSPLCLQQGAAVPQNHCLQAEIFYLRAKSSGGADSDSPFLISKWSNTLTQTCMILNNRMSKYQCFVLAYLLALRLHTSITLTAFASWAQAQL